MPPPEMLGISAATSVSASCRAESSASASWARPLRKRICVSREPVRTEPKLTTQIISQWALSKARVELNSKPVKAPRFVSPTLRAQPTAVYTAGFSPKTASVDPGRFSGNAVNFMEVRKFDKANGITE